MLDYVMSEKFGLNWKKTDAKRINTIITIMGAQAKDQEIEKRKNLN